MKLIIVAALVAVAVAAPSYEKPYEKPHITIVSQVDSRNSDGSGKWSSAGSDGATREESTAQKQVNYESGNTNQGTAYWITPEGERITLSWVADENGFRPEGSHLPTPPPIPKEIADMLPLLPKLVEPEYPAKPYKN